MIGQLPTSLTVDGKEYRIRTDFRDVLNIIAAFNDPELEDKDKILVCMIVLYEDFENMPMEAMEDGYTQAMWFIDCGAEAKEGKHPRTMDWEQDERILFPAVNRIAGFETRSCDYLHWWTFMGYFMEINDGVFSQVLSLRQKKAKGKKLEKWEREFWSSNKDLCVLKEKLTKEEQEEKDRLNKLFS